MKLIPSSILSALGVACFLGTVSAQTLTVSPQQLTFNVPAGVASSASQMVTVTPDAVAANGRASFAVNAGAPWLLVNGTSSGITTVPSTGATLSVNVNTQGLTNAQTYSGSFTVQVLNTPSSQKTVFVTLSVGGTSNLTAAPSSLSFTAVQGASVGTPSSQTVTIASASGAVSFSVASTTQSGGSWLSVSSTGGVTGGPTATFSVSAIPTGLAPASYTGTIAVSTASGDLVQIGVGLTVSASAVLTVKPTPQPFLYQVGGATPAPQAISITTNGTSVPVSLNLNPSVSWLVLSPLSGTVTGDTPLVVTLTATPSGLPPGTYNTSLVITPAGGSALAGIPVTLVVTANPILQVSPTSLTFTGAFAGQPPIDQTVSVGAQGGSTGFTVSTDSSWLSASASGSATPSTITVHVNTSGLAVGSYSGSVNVKPANGDNYVLAIPVTLTVANPVQVTASPSTLLFSFQTNQGAPPSQNIQIASSGQPVQFTLTPTTSNCGSGWLTASASQNITPATATVSVTTAGLPASGACTGTIALNYTGATSPVQIAVSVAISGSALLRISQPPGFGMETVQQGASGSGVITRTISLTSTDSVNQVAFTASATSTGGWLTAGPGTGNTPQNLLVNIVPGGLAPGTYGGQVVIASSSLPNDIGRGTFTMPVTLTVNPPVTVTVSPVSLAFQQAQGGPVPSNQSLTLTSAGGTASFTATITQVTGGDWLDVNPKSGSANRDLTVSIKANSLPASATPYSAQIALAFQNSSTAPVVVPVTLTVGSAQSITTTPTALNFAFQIGSSPPAAQKLSVASSGGTGAQFSVGTTSTPGGWLSVDATSGTTPKDLNVSVNPQNLSAGTFNGSISISSAGLATVNVPVTLTVTAAVPPQPVSVTNTASNLAGSISAGELITVKGTSLGPVSPPNNGLFSLNSRGGVDPILNGVRVLFDGIQGTPIYTSAVQLNAIAPWEIAGRVSTSIVVEYNGVQSQAVTVRVDNVTPAIYTLNNTGSGQAAVINQDNSYNGPLSSTTKPATQNSVIAVYANGGGQTNPAGATGSVTPLTTLFRIPGVVTATIGGQNAVVEFIGDAPSLVTGVVQVNLRVPTGVSGNSLPVSFSINGVATASGPTVAVQ